MRVRFRWLPGVLVLCFAGPALGQAPAIGSVRVVFPGGEALLGELVSARGDSVVIRDGQGERRSYPASAVARVDVRRPGSRLENAVLGFGFGLAGTTVGTVIILSTQEDLQKVFLAPICIPLGMVIGAVVPRGTRWVPRQLPKVNWDGRAMQVGFSLSVP